MTLEFTMRKNNRTVGVGGFQCSDLAKKYVNQVLEEGRLSYGKWHRNFEKQFSHLHECRHAEISPIQVSHVSDGLVDH